MVTCLDPPGGLDHGHLPVTSTSNVKLRKVRITTMAPRMPTLRKSRLYGNRPYDIGSNKEFESQEYRPAQLASISCIDIYRCILLQVAISSTYGGKNGSKGNNRNSRDLQSRSRWLDNAFNDFHRSLHRTPPEDLTPLDQTRNYPALSYPCNLLKTKDSRKPAVVTRPTTAPPSSYASGIIVLASIVRIAPAAKAWIPPMMFPDTPASSQ